MQASPENHSQSNSNANSQVALVSAVRALLRATMYSGSDSAKSRPMASVSICCCDSRDRTAVGAYRCFSVRPGCFRLARGPWRKAFSADEFEPERLRHPGCGLVPSRGCRDRVRGGVGQTLGGVDQCSGFESTWVGFGRSRTGFGRFRGPIWLASTILGPCRPVMQPPLKRVNCGVGRWIREGNPMFGCMRSGTLKITRAVEGVGWGDAPSLWPRVARLG